MSSAQLTEPFFTQWTLVFGKRDQTAPVDQADNSAALVTPFYTLHERLGQGGNGEVWAATQHSLLRRVAVKRIRRDMMEHLSDGESRRLLVNFFQQEALTTACLQHPNIVPIHDLGVDENGDPLIAMKLVRGRSWKSVLDEEAAALGRGSDSFDFLSRHVRILISVAQAIAYAHACGVVHRDIKPSQVMIGEFGEVLVMDWGLAYFYERDSEALQPASDAPLLLRFAPVSNPAGTPCYMAPEQTEETLDRLGPWTDVFLLGATLYYILTGHPPHDEEDSTTAVAQAGVGAIVPPRKRAPERDIPPELEALAMRAMSPDPDRRPPSVKVFIAELEDYLFGANRRHEARAIADEIRRRMESRPDDYRTLAELLSEADRAGSLWPGTPGLSALKDRLSEALAREALRSGDLTLAHLEAHRLSDPTKRAGLLAEVDAAHRVRVRRERERKTALLGALALAVLIILGGWQYVRDQRAARRAAEKARHVAEQSRRAADEARRRAEAASAEASAQRTLAEAARTRAEYEQYVTAIGFANSYFKEGRTAQALGLLLDHTPAHLRQAEWGFLMAQLQADDMTLARGQPNDELLSADFSPDGGRIAVGRRSGALSVFDSHSGRRLYTVRPHSKGIWSITYFPGGDYLLTTSFDNTAAILDASSGALRLSLRGHTHLLRAGAVSSDGTRVATTSMDKTVRLWDASNANTLWAVPLPDVTYSVAFSPDGRRLAVGTLNQTVFVLDAVSGEVLRAIEGFNGNVLNITFDAHGRRMLSAASKGDLYLHDALTGELIRRIDSGAPMLHDARFGPGETLIASADDEGACRFWDAETGRLVDIVPGTPRMYKVRFSPDGGRFMTLSEAEARVWSLERRLGRTERLDPASIPAGAPVEHHRAISFPYHLKDLWKGMDDVWLEGDGRRWLRRGGNYYCIDSYYSVFNPDATQRISIGRDVFDAAVYRTVGEGRPVKVLAPRNVYCAAFSPSGRLAAIGCMDGSIYVWDAHSWEELVHVYEPGRNAVWSFMFAPGERRLLFGHVLGGIECLDLESGEFVYSIAAHAKGVVSLALSPDGTRFASASSDGTAAVWDLNTGARLQAMTGHTTYLYGAEFSPDGARILTASGDGTVKLWDAANGRELLSVFEAADRKTLSGAFFSTDGRRIVIVLSDGNLVEREIMPWRDEDYPAPGREESGGAGGASEKDKTGESSDSLKGVAGTSYADAGGAAGDFTRRVELWKRRRHLSPAIEFSDIAW